VIAVAPDGKVTVNNQSLTREELSEKLSRVASLFPGQAVILKGDGDAEFTFVMSVLDLCQKAGFAMSPSPRTSSPHHRLEPVSKLFRTPHDVFRPELPSPSSPDSPMIRNQIHTTVVCWAGVSILLFGCG